MEIYSYGMVSLEKLDRLFSKEPSINDEPEGSLKKIDWTYKDSGLFLRSGEPALHADEDSQMYQDAVQQVTSAMQDDFDSIEDLIPQFIELFEDGLHADCVRWVLKPQKHNISESSYEFQDQMKHHGSHPFSRLAKLKFDQRVVRDGNERYLDPVYSGVRDLAILALPMGVRNLGHGENGYTEGRTLRDAAEAALAIYSKSDFIKRQIPIL